MIVRLRGPIARDSRVEGSLATGQCYSVIGIEADDYRILDDTGRPYLYPASVFEVVDATEPADWEVDLGEDGERYAYPQELNSPGFFEDFFDGDAQAIAIFWHVVNMRLSSAA